jgi:hypothetical protein
MPITFSINLNDGYLTAAYTGKISDEELLASWKNFFQGVEWIPGLNELADLSQADLTGITAGGLESLVSYAKRIYDKHNIRSVKVAIYAPKPLHFGLARMYEAITYNQPQSVEVFRSLQEAVSWIKGTTQE